MTRSSSILALALVLLVACETTEEEGPGLDTACTDHLQIIAAADSELTSSGARVFGTIASPLGVTVRAVYVAGTKVPRTEFNFRGFQVDIPEAQLRANASNGTATLPVIAYTSLGCDEVPEDSRPRIELPSDGDAGE